MKKLPVIFVCMAALLCACAKNEAKTTGSAETGVTMPVAREPSPINAGIEGAWSTEPLSINNPAASSGVCCFGKEFDSVFNIF